METLLHTDWQRMHEFLKSIYTPCKLNEFPMRVLAALPGVVGADLFAAVSFGDHKTILPRAYAFPTPEIGMAAEQFIVQPQNFLCHPVARYHVQTDEMKYRNAMNVEEYSVFK
ncbi:hypothetical protein QM565_05435 [Geitlerinema splendidum]|nr:hypothetical protein [Geitlerinema splendidum]